MTKDSVVHLQPLVTQAKNVERAGWIGGHPCLSADVDYPVRDGIPYQFLLQIDCARMPTTTWGGLMPRTGWIAVFVSGSGPVDAKLIHSTEAMFEHRPSDAWEPERSALYSFAKDYRKYLEPPVAWPLSFAKDGPPSPTRQRPKEDFNISDKANWPLDRETHILLMEEAIRCLDDRAQKLADVARQRAAQLHTPSQRLLDALEEMKALAVDLGKAWHASSRWWQFNARRWLKRRDDLIRLRLLSDEWQLEINQGFDGVLGLARIQKANNIGQWPSKVITSPYFAPSTPAGRSHALILASAEKLKDELDHDPEVPKQESRRMGPDYASWATYRSLHPEQWMRYKDRILKVRRDFYDFWLANQEAVNQLLGGWDQFPLPASWEQAIDGVSQSASWADDQIAKLGSGPSDADTAFMSERSETAQRAENESNKIRTELMEFKKEISEYVYSAENCSDFFKKLQELSDGNVIGDYWHVNYDVIRSEVGKRIYAYSPDLLTPPVRARLEGRWQFDAEQATIQLGGKPRGYCHSVGESRSRPITLFQIPSNHLTALAFGDVSDLVISISDAALREGRFDLAKCDIAN